MQPIDFAGIFLQRVWGAAALLWNALTANPWLLVMVVVVLAAGIALRVAPRRRRRSR